jgi:hypothetical protein
MPWKRPRSSTTPCCKYRLRKSASQSGISVGGGAKKAQQRGKSAPSACETNAATTTAAASREGAKKQNRRVVSPATENAVPSDVLLPVNKSVTAKVLPTATPTTIA